MTYDDFVRGAPTFRQMGLHDPPPGGAARARAIHTPVLVRGFGGTPDHLALNIGGGMWAIHVPMRELAPEQRETAVKELTRMAPEIGAEARDALRECVRETQPPETDEKEEAA